MTKFVAGCPNKWTNALGSEVFRMNNWQQLQDYVTTVSNNSSVAGSISINTATTTTAASGKVSAAKADAPGRKMKVRNAACKTSNEEEDDDYHDDSAEDSTENLRMYEASCTLLKPNKSN
jgi:hypothetical protein